MIEYYVIFCMKRLCVKLFVLPFFAQDANKHNISIGLWDYKTVMPFSYTYNINEDS
tara:strand:+ start:214 stop:381 length:168 start_codon:yes stop_codon:yes gene_type:complete